MTESKGSRESQLIRDLVAGFDHDDVYLIASALRREAVMLDAMDAQYPDEQRRAHCVRLNELSFIFFRANQARSFIETGE